MTPTEKQERILSLTKQQKVLLDSIAYMSKMKPSNKPEMNANRFAKCVIMLNEIFKLEVQKETLAAIPNFTRGTNTSNKISNLAFVEREEIILKKTKDQWKNIKPL